MRFRQVYVALRQHETIACARRGDGGDSGNGAAAITSTTVLAAKRVSLGDALSVTFSLRVPEGCAAGGDGASLPITPPALLSVSHSLSFDFVGDGADAAVRSAKAAAAREAREAAQRAEAAVEAAEADATSAAREEAAQKAKAVAEARYKARVAAAVVAAAVTEAAAAEREVGRKERHRNYAAGRARDSSLAFCAPVTVVAATATATAAGGQRRIRDWPARWPGTWGSGAADTQRRGDYLAAISLREARLHREVVRDS